MNKDRNSTATGSFEEMTSFCSTSYANIAVLIEMMLRICVIYPPDHIRFIDITDKYFEKMSEIANDGKELHITVNKDGLMIQSELLDSELIGVSHINDLLSSLGIIQIVISHSVSAEDLHHLISELIRCRCQAKGRRSFGQFTFTDIPETIKVKQREFGKKTNGRGGSTHNDDLVAEAVEKISKILQKRQCDRDTRVVYTGLVEKIFTKVIEKLELNPLKSNNPTLNFECPHEEILSLGVHAIQHAMTELFSNHGNNGDLSHLFTYAEKALAFAENEEFVKLMVEILRETEKEEEDQSKPEPSKNNNDDDSEYSMSLDDLRGCVAGLSTNEHELGTLLCEDQGSELSVLCHVLMSYPIAQVLRGVEVKLEGCLKKELSATELQILECVTEELVAKSDIALLDRSLPLIIKPLRRSKTLSVAEFLLMVSQACPVEKLALLWPHLVNQILIGFMKDSPTAVDELYNIVMRLPESEMKEGITRLERLDAMDKRLLTEKLFHPPDKRLYPLFARLLLSSSGALVGSNLLSGFHASPPDWIGAGVFAVMDEYDPSYQELFVKFLREGKNPGVSEALKQLAGVIITEKLYQLKEDAKCEPKVLKAIKSLGSLKFEKAKSVLRGIVKERKLVFWRRWPAEYRRAARESLVKLDPRMK